MLFNCENRPFYLTQKEERKQLEKEILENVKKERELLRDKQDIERYFTPDINNPIDQEVVDRLRHDNLYTEERKCELYCQKD
jgi:hypothetical protein